MKKYPLSTPTRLLALSAGLACTFGLATQSHADLLAYEPFAYDTKDGTGFFDNDLLGMDGGTGWARAWEKSEANRTPNDQAPIIGGNLVYIDQHGNQLVVDSSSNSAQVWGRPENLESNPLVTRANTTVGRQLAAEFLDDKSPASLVSTEGKVYYLSFVGQRLGEAADPTSEIYEVTNEDGTKEIKYPWGNNLYPRAAGIRFQPAGNNNSARAVIGNTSNTQTNTWSLIAGNNKTANDEGYIVTDAPFGGQEKPDFVIVRIEYFNGVKYVNEKDGAGNNTGNIITEDAIGTKVSMWVNPTNLAVENPDEAFSSTLVDYDRNLDRYNAFYLNIGAIGIEGNDDSGNRPHSGFAIDELRLGTTWASVTPHEQGGGPTDPVVEQNPEVFFAATADANNWILAAGELGYVHVGEYSWIYSDDLQDWIGLVQGSTYADGAYFYIPSEEEYWHFSSVTYPWVYIFGTGWTYLEAAE